MFFIKKYAIAIAGFCAGAVNGLFGAGGGMVLVPILDKYGKMDGQEVFSTSVSIILPICLVSLIMTLNPIAFDWLASLPYLLGSGIGGILAGITGKKIPTIWLHRALGILIIWGGIKFIC